jgi:hypothetical protein
MPRTQPQKSKLKEKPEKEEMKEMDSKMESKEKVDEKTAEETADTKSEQKDSESKDKTVVVGTKAEQNMDMPDADTEKPRVAPANIKITGDEAAGVRVMMKPELPPVHIRDMWESGIMQHLTPVNKIPYYDQGHKIKIDMFSDRRSYLEALFNLVTKLAKHHEGIPVMAESGMTEVEPAFKLNKVLDRKRMGFDVFGAISSLESDRYKNVVPSLKGLETREESNLYEVSVGVALTDVEHRLYEAGKAYSSQEIGEVSEAYEFLRVFDNTDYQVAQPPKLDYNRVKFRRPPRMLAYEEFVMKNTLLWPLFQDWSLSVAKQSIPITVDDGSSLVSELANTLELRLGKFTVLNTLPQKVSMESARSYVYSMWMALNMGSICRISFQFALKVFEPASLLDALINKLMYPYYAVTPESRLDNDNYLAKYLLPAFMTTSPIYNETEALTRQKNFLTLNIAAGALAKYPGLADFLRTTENGDGWLSAGGYRGIPIPTQSKKFLNKRERLYMPLAGKLLDSPEDAEKILQWERFYRMAEEMTHITSARFKFPQYAQLPKALQAMMGLVQSKSDALSSLCYYFDRMQDNMSSMSTLLPTKDFVTTDSNIIEMPARGFSGFNALMLLGSKAMDMTRLNLEVIEGGFAMHHFVNEFTERYYVAKRFLQSPFWRTRDVLRHALDAVPTDPGIKARLNTSFGDAAIKDSLKVPSQLLIRRNYIDYVGIILTEVMKQPELFGFTRSWGFTVTPAKDTSNILFSESWISPTPKKTDMVIDTKQLELLIQERRIGKIVRDVRKQKYSVFFQVPVKIDYALTEMTPSQPTLMKIAGDLTSSSTFDLGTLTYYYTPKDVVFRQDENDNFDARDPEYTQNNAGPLTTVKQEMQIPEYFKIVVVRQAGFKFFTFRDFVFKQRYESH